MYLFLNIKKYLFPFMNSSLCFSTCTYSKLTVFDHEPTVAWNWPWFMVDHSQNFKMGKLLLFVFIALKIKKYFDYNYVFMVFYYLFNIDLVWPWADHGLHHRRPWSVSTHHCRPCLDHGQTWSTMLTWSNFHRGSLHTHTHIYI